MPQKGFFLILSCTLFLIHPYLCLCLDCPAFCLSVFTRNTTQPSLLRRDFVRTFFSFFPSVLFIHCLPLYPLSSCHLFLYNTNIRAPGGLRSRNPSKRSAADRSATAIGTITFSFRNDQQHEDVLTLALTISLITNITHNLMYTDGIKMKRSHSDLL